MAQAWRRTGATPHRLAMADDAAGGTPPYSFDGHFIKAVWRAAAGVVRWFAAAAVARCGLRLGCATQFARSSCCGVVFVYAAATDAANKEFAGLILRANQPGWCLRAAAVAAADADD